MSTSRIARTLALVALTFAATPLATLPTASAAGMAAAPGIEAPTRGSVTGTLAATTFGAEGLAMGALSWPLPLSLPDARVSVPIAIAPVYSPGQGLSEWGLGFATSLALVRFRDVGDVTFTSDDGLTGPFGPMARGEDGAFYSHREGSSVRVREEGEALVAYLPDGSRWTFGATTRMPGAGGTFMWLLEHVRTPTGQEARFAYDARPGTRPLLTSMTLGHESRTPVTRVRFEYDPLTTPFVDYRAGVRTTLDRRVARVVMDATNASLADGAWAERYRYEVGYERDDRGVGFRIATLSRVFASGAREPLLRVSYGDGSNALAQAAAVRDTTLDALADAGPSGAVVGRVALVDWDLDGRVDVENATTLGLSLRRASGFENVAPPDLTSVPAGPCRPTLGATATPRAFTWVPSLVLREPVAFVTQIARGVDAASSTTTLLACLRSGVAAAQVQIPGAWELGHGVELTDVTRDRVPDLVRFAGTTLEVARLGADAGVLSLHDVVRSPTASSGRRDAFVVADTNGDGIADVVERTGGTLRVWAGMGRGLFDGSAPATLLFRDARQTGVPRVVTDLDSATFTFLDANEDGLPDVVAAKAGAVRLYLNTGASFDAFDVPGFHGVDGSLEAPFVADLTGSGDRQVAFFRRRAGVAAGYVVRLDSPGRGLLATIDDGRGNRIALTYGRAPVEAQIPERGVVLATATHTSLGEGSVARSYTFAKAHLHGHSFHVTGYGAVGDSTDSAETHVAFDHDDDTGPLERSQQQTDPRVPGVTRIGFTEHDVLSPFGVRTFRIRKRGHGVLVATNGAGADATRSVVKVSETRRFERFFCPAETVTENLHGTLTTTTTYEALPAFEDHFACIAATTTSDGHHADATLDFHEEERTTHDARGLATSHASVGAQGLLVDTDVTYTDDGLVETVSHAGRGSTRVVRDAATRLPTTLRTPDGTESSVTARDGVTDALLALTVRHGILVSSRAFRYDGHERLASTWSSVGPSTEASPAARFSYRDADLDAGLPGLLRADALIDVVEDADATVTSRRASVDLVSGTGATLASMSRVSLGYTATKLALREAAIGRTTSYERDLVAGDVESLNVDALFAGARSTATATRSSLDVVLEARTSFHEGVALTVRGELGLDTDGGAGLASTSVENGRFRTSRASDADGRVLAYRNAEGARMSATYDVRGRLVALVTAGAARHTVAYDDYGRVKMVTRGGVARIAYRYDDVTGLLLEKQVRPVASALALRTTRLAYDGAGRTVGLVHTDASGAEEAFAFLFDGATPDAPGTRGRDGLLTGIVGPGFARTFEHRADGAVVRRVLRVDGFRIVDEASDLREDESLRARTTVVRDARAGRTISIVRDATDLDAFGQATRVRLNGRELLRYAYDREGLLAFATTAADAANGSAEGVVTFPRDPLPRRSTGVNVASDGVAGSASTHLSNRGLVESEVFTSGSSRVARAYFAHRDPALFARAVSAHGAARFTSVVRAAPSGYDAATDAIVFDALRHAHAVYRAKALRVVLLWERRPPAETWRAPLGALVTALTHDDDAGVRDAAVEAVSTLALAG